MIEKNILSADGVKIHYEVREDNNPDKTFVFIHGFGGCMRAFDPLISHFQKKNFKIINIDLRAHGKSERPKKDYQYGLNYFLNDIIQILEEEKAKNITLFGHCFGGILSLNLAITHPKLIKSLILINTSYKAPNLSRLIYKYFPFKRFFYFLLNFFPHIYLKKYPSYVKYEKSGDFNAKRISSDIMHTSPKSYLYISREIVGFDFADKVSQIQSNVLLIHGEKDRVFPVKIAYELRKKLKHSKLEIIKKANHLLVLNSNQELINIIEKNLAEKFI